MRPISINTVLMDLDQAIPGPKMTNVALSPSISEIGLPTCRVYMVRLTDWQVDAVGGTGLDSIHPSLVCIALVPVSPRRVLPVVSSQ